MADAFTIDGKKLLPIREAALQVSYSKDYITRLAREQKIVARLIGRQWFVELTSLQSYEESARLEQELRKRRLSDERKRERELRSLRDEQVKSRVSQAANNRSAMRASALAAFAVVCGFGVAATLSGIEQPNLSVPTTDSQAATLITSDPTASARWQPAEAVVPNFTIATTSYATTTTAVVLLPEAGPTGVATVTEMFSDNVTTRRMPDGSRVLVKTDEATGAQHLMPFVMIPVPEETKQLGSTTSTYE